MIGCSQRDAGLFKNDNGQVEKLFDMYIMVTMKVSS